VRVCARSCPQVCVCVYMYTHTFIKSHTCTYTFYGRLAQDSIWAGFDHELVLIIWSFLNKLEGAQIQLYESWPVEDEMDSDVSDSEWSQQEQEIEQEEQEEIGEDRDWR